MFIQLESQNSIFVSFGWRNDESWCVNEQKLSLLWLYKMLVAVILLLFGAVICYPPVMSKSCEKQPPEVFCKKGVLRKPRQSHWEAPLPESFFNKVAGWSLQFYLKKRWHMYFPMNFEKFLRKPFSRITSGRLLLLSWNWHKVIQPTETAGGALLNAFMKGL